MCAKLSDTAIIDEVLGAFLPMTKIPRPSGHEEKISAYLYEWALSHGFSAVRDEVGNVIFDVPATPGYEDRPTVALQAHMDMVFASRAEDGLDPLTTPVTAVQDGDILRSDGKTSLGADDAIGIAMALCVAENKMPHGALRVIVTVSEETDFTGVNHLDPKILDGVDYMINIDSEDEGRVTVSTASGMHFDYKADFPVSPANGKALLLRLSGLSGGHSGMCIGNGLLNANKAVFTMLDALSNESIRFELSRFDGGVATNAIPDTAEAVITLAESDVPAMKAAVSAVADNLKAAHAASDPGFTLTVSETSFPASVLSPEDSARVAAFGASLFDGVYTWSRDMEGLVESSSNLGIVHIGDGKLCVRVMARSSSPAMEAEIVGKMKSASETYAIPCDIIKGCDAWPYNPHSRLLALTQKVYRERFGKDIVVEAIHAGLECGRFSLYKPSLEMISIGPTACNAHSVKEYCVLSTIPKVWYLIADILENIG